MTYSIVARDATTGQLGVAVQSHYFSTGTVVPWAEAGVGAVATQAMANVSYGPLGVALMRGGLSASAALDGLRQADAGAATRQVAMVDAAGGAAAHTGERCIAEAGHRSGEGWSVQANMMRRDTVPDAMAVAYEAAVAGQLELTERLLVALDAAEAEGGDIRGRQSAALLVVSGEPTGRVWDDVLFDVRVDDHADPLGELRRLVGLTRAYRDADRAEQLMADGDTAAAAEIFGRAHGAMGDNPELEFWHGVVLAAAGKADEAAEHLRRAFAVHDGWSELLRRLPPSGLFPDDRDLLASLIADATE